MEEPIETIEFNDQLTIPDGNLTFADVNFKIWCKAHLKGCVI
jgi:hypothetical protein